MAIKLTSSDKRMAGRMAAMRQTAIIVWRLRIVRTNPKSVGCIRGASKVLNLHIRKTSEAGANDTERMKGLVSLSECDNE